MFKSFTGYHLVEAYHARKKNRPQKSTQIKALKIIIVSLISLLLWCIPSESFGIPNLTLTEQRTIAVFVFASLMWLTEGISSWVFVIGNIY